MFLGEGLLQLHRCFFANGLFLSLLQPQVALRIACCFHLHCCSTAQVWQATLAQDAREDGLNAVLSADALAVLWSSSVHPVTWRLWVMNSLHLHTMDWNMWDGIHCRCVSWHAQQMWEWVVMRYHSDLLFENLWNSAFLPVVDFSPWTWRLTCFFHFLSVSLSPVSYMATLYLHYTLSFQNIVPSICEWFTVLSVWSPSPEFIC